MFDERGKFACHGDKPSLALFSVCNKIYEEALPFFYAKNQFKLSPSSLSDLQTAFQNINVVALRSILSFHIDLTDPFFELLDNDNPFTNEFISGFDSLCAFLATTLSTGQLSNFTFATNTLSMEVAYQLASSLSRLPVTKSAAISFGPLDDLRSLARSTSDRLTQFQYQAASPEKPFRFFSLPQELRFEILRHTSLVPKSRSIPNMALEFKGRRLTKYSLCCALCTSVIDPCCCSTNPAAWSPTCDCRLDPCSLFLVNKQLQYEAYTVLGTKNVWAFHQPSAATIELLSRMPAKITAAICHIVILIEDINIYCPWKELDESQRATEARDLQRWKGLLRVMGTLMNVSNLWLQIDVGSFECCSWIGQEGGPSKEVVRAKQLVLLGCIGKELRRPKRLWIKGMLSDCEDQEIERSVMGEQYDSFSEGKGSSRYQYWGWWG
ncbi:hypothetical protein MMC10_005403 [Thelotrema lepadinum]|nr:hypothetical protein [Thelotrema lepadinum]